MRAGKDVTILCYSRMRYVVMQAVQQLEKMGYNPEVHAPPTPRTGPAQLLQLDDAPCGCVIQICVLRR